MLDLKRVAVFREVVRHGSFSAAAATLNYSQPAVPSLRLAELC